MSDVSTVTRAITSSLTTAGLTIAVSISAAAQAPASTPLPLARELIGRFATATNVAVMAKHTSVRTTGTLEMPSAGVSGDLVIAQARPNKSMMRVELAGIGRIEQGFDGTNGWNLNPLTGPRLLAGRELDAMREESSFGVSSRQGPNVASSETVERTEMNGEACYKVKVVWKSGRETFDCYSVATGYLIASLSKQETPMGTADVTNLISDYKEFGGQMVATRITQQVMGQEQVIRIAAVDYDAADPASFEMPPAIKALMTKTP